MSLVISPFLVYIALLVFIIFGILVYCYIANLNKINSEVAILQKDNPTDGEIQDLLVQKQPTIFADVLYEWEAIAEIFDMPLELITELLAAKTFVDLLTDHLNPYAMLFSRGWKFQASERTAETYKESNFRLESNHRHLIAQITGIQRIYIASPNQTNFMVPVETSGNITRCSVNFFNPPDDAGEFNKLQYMEIVLREGNLLYIPRGWWYLQKVEAPCLVLECVNESLFS